MSASPHLRSAEQGHQGATYSVASGQGRSGHSCGTHTDVGGPGVFADPGPFPRGAIDASSAREHQYEDKAAATIAGFRFSVSTKSVAALMNARKVPILLSGRLVCGGPSP